MIVSFENRANPVNPKKKFEFSHQKIFALNYRKYKTAKPPKNVVILFQTCKIVVVLCKLFLLLFFSFYRIIITHKMTLFGFETF